MFDTEYRIITNIYNHYCTQYKYWYWPFWFDLDPLSCDTLDKAKQIINDHIADESKKKKFKSEVVWESHEKIH